jgi:hypothetical protein
MRHAKSLGSIIADINHADVINFILRSSREACRNSNKAYQRRGDRDE